MVKLTLEERMRSVHFKVDDEPHVRVRVEICRECTVRPCIYACPANLFTPLDDGSMMHNHVECFECGTCYIVCDRAAIEWAYPRGGYGVTFREA